MSEEPPATLDSHPAPEVLAAFARGDLPPAELSAVAGHVETCDACCAALRDVPTDPLAGLARAAAAAPTQRMPLTVASSAAPAPVGDTRALLHKRLRFLALMLTSALVANLLLIGGSDQALDVWVYFNFGVLGLGAAAGVVLWVRRSLPLRQLRVTELIIFGALYFQGSSTNAVLYPRLLVLPQPPVWYGSVVAQAVGLPWSVLIILYGILIPNTWRRCAAVVGVMAVTPVVISVANGLAAQVTEGHSSTNYLFPLGFWMAVSVAIAVYGSHRIEVLRREVAAARELGQYRLKERLGSGGMGEVYLAEHVLLKQPCAVKLIRPEKAGDPATLARFEREVRATARLRHWNTVRIFDYGRSADGTFYYVMEHLSGLTLQELVERDGPLPAGRAVHLLRQACLALREAHAAGLVHRDLKPANVMACELGGEHDVVKVLDFGLVKVVDPGGAGTTLTREGVIAGTPAYVSPEQASGGVGLDARSDVYSLGAVAYFLLTGRPPFDRDTALRTIVAHLHDPVARPTELRPEVPADLEAVVLRCLEKDPAKRFADVGDLETALAACGCVGEWHEEAAARWWSDRPAGGLAE
jgi:serine/threonine-protein kinase